MQLSLDTDDHFFHHINQSARASAITPRRPSIGQNTRLQGVPSVRSTSRVTPHVGDLSLTALRLEPEFLGYGFSELFATRWFPGFMTVLILGIYCC